MNKIIALLMAALMLLSLAACAKDNTEPSPSQSEAVTESFSDEQSSTQESSSEATGDKTFGETLHAAFLDAMAENPDATTLELAELLASNPIIAFGPVTMPMEPGYLPGFPVDIDGFAECTQFAPMISSIPFVGYVFRLDDGADVDTFVQNLTDNADPSWNICTTAEETIVDHVGNTVFFVMCPRSAE